MKMTTVFPLILMVLYICTSLTYAISGDWKRALYWAGAFIITLSVTV